MLLGSSIPKQNNAETKRSRGKGEKIDNEGCSKKEAHDPGRAVTRRTEPRQGVCSGGCL